MIYLQLFWTFFKIGAFTFGGGYAMIPLIQEAVLEEHGWITTQEFLDMLAIAEMTPGPVAINSATFVGERVAGVGGAICATLGVVLPSVIVITVIAKFLTSFSEDRRVKRAFSWIRPVVSGLLLSAVFSIGTKTLIDIKGLILAIIFFIILQSKKISPILLIVIAAITGIILY